MNDKSIIEDDPRTPIAREWRGVIDDDQELRQMREELDELTVSMMMAGDRIDRTRRTSIVAMIVGIASLGFLAGVVVVRLAGWL